MKKSKFFPLLFLILIIFGIFCIKISFSQKPSLEIANQPYPTVSDVSVSPSSADQGATFIINAKVTDISGVSSVVAFLQNPDETNIATVQLYDDGSHNDDLANDGKYGNSWDSSGAPVGNYYIDIKAKDILGFATETENVANFKITSSGCTPTCSAIPGCLTFSPSNSHITGGVCCGAGENCYACDSGYCWTGTDCIQDLPPVPKPRVGKNPSPTALSVVVVAGETVYFDGSTYSFDPPPGQGQIVKYEWDFEGDGIFDWQSFISGITTYIYNIPGTYHPLLRVTDNCGKTAVASAQVKVNPPFLTATISSPPDDTAFAQGDPINFQALITGGTLPYTIEWTSNIDGVIGASSSFVKNDLTGVATSTVIDHIITLKVTDASGVVATDTITIHIPPQFWDWRNVNGENWMTPVKNQGACGACWAFATIGSMEAKYKIEKGDSSLTPDLSEQYLISDCCPIGDCNGGNCAFNFIKTNGVPTEDCYGYLQTDSPCPATCDDASPIELWKITNTDSVTPKILNNRGELQYGLIKYGPLYVKVGVGGGTTGSLDDDGCDIYKCLPGANHAMVLVGYNNVKRYWILKNSWGGIPGDPCFDGYESFDFDTCLLGTHMSGDYGEGIIPPP